VQDKSAGFTPQLALPNNELFIQAKTASDLFNAVKEIAGLADWHVILEKGEAREAQSSPSLVEGAFSENYALGTFSVEGNTPVIRYNPSLLKNPDALIATFAHELAHLLIDGIGNPPGGHDLHEHATDCAAVYLGFGIFLANGARNFEQFQEAGMHGWRADASGYLSENTLVTALAIFEDVFGISKGSEDFLKSYLKSDYSKAKRYLAKYHPNLAADLVSFDLSEWA
jgi:hypothetical protein